MAYTTAALPPWFLYLKRMLAPEYWQNRSLGPIIDIICYFRRNPWTPLQTLNINVDKYTYVARNIQSLFRAVTSYIYIYIYIYR